MTESEIVELVRLVNAGYSNAKPVPPEALPIWHEDLAELPAAQVKTAFTAYRRRGAAFPPNSAGLRQAALEMERPGVTFEHVWAEIGRTIKGIGRERANEALRALASVPFALELVTAMGGWAAVCNGGPDEVRPTDPGVWRSQAEHAFKALSAQRRDDEALAGLPGLRAEAATTRLVGGLTAIADIRPTWGAAPLLPGTRLALPPAPLVAALAEPLRVMPQQPAQERDRARLVALIPADGPTYRHGPSCVCERCMPVAAAPAPESPPAAEAARPARPRPRRRSRQRGHR